MKVLTQLNFGGNCEEAFSFYEQHMGGKILMMLHQDEAPGSAATGEAGRAVIHARLAIGDTVLLGNDVPSSRFQKMRSVYIYLSVDSVEEAERMYKLLSQGGEVYTPLAETFYATRFSQLRDRFGVSWSLIHERT
jgi:PhnB protein